MASRSRFVRLSNQIINLDAVAYINLSVPPALGASEVVFTAGTAMEALALNFDAIDTATLLAALDADERAARAPLLAEYARLRERLSVAHLQFTRLDRLAMLRAEHGLHLSPEEQAGRDRAEEDGIAAGHELETFEQAHPDIVALAREGEDR